jgi:hypothetical protein
MMARKSWLKFFDPKTSFSTFVFTPNTFGTVIKTRKSSQKPKLTRNQKST